MEQRDGTKTPVSCLSADRKMKKANLPTSEDMEIYDDLALVDVPDSVEYKQSEHHQLTLVSLTSRCSL